MLITFFGIKNWGNQENSTEILLVNVGECYFQDIIW